MELSKKTAKVVTTFAGAVALGAGIMSTTANADTVYTVQSGDTLSGIVQKFGMGQDAVDTIAANNHLANKNLIFVGEKLTIPDNGQAVSQNDETLAGNNNQNATVNNGNGVNAAASNAGTNAATASTQSNVYQTVANYSTVSGNEAQAKAWIAARESGGSYTAVNGQYIGKYQLSFAYLNGDYSPANQERAADSYVASRYGSWTAAQAFWQAHGWY